jgi:hypothetical protein
VVGHLEYLLLAFTEKPFDKLIINNTLLTIGDASFNFENISDFIPNYINDFVRSNRIIFYATGLGSTLKYYNSDSQTFVYTEPVKIDFNCNKIYNSTVFDGRCPLDYYPLDDVLNNRFNKDSSGYDPKRELQLQNPYGNIFKQKYLKYKQKYLNLKKVINY